MHISLQIYKNLCDCVTEKSVARQRSQNIDVHIDVVEADDDVDKKQDGISLGRGGPVEN